VEGDEAAAVLRLLEQEPAGLAVAVRTVREERLLVLSEPEPATA